jgi:pimeloyl-ACP methyl ester carboxylesterase
MQEQYFPLGARRLHGAVGPPNGPPLVLFHGVTRCWRDFEPLLPGLLPHWHVLALDHRGHGRSDHQSDYRVADFAVDAVAFLEAFVPGPAVLLGHSLGAMVAAVVAAQRPRQVRALVLEDPPGTALAGGFRQSRFHLQFTNTERVLATTRDVEVLTRALAHMEVQHPQNGTVVRFRELRALSAIRFGAECLLQMDPAVLSPLLAGRWLEGLDWFGALPAIECATLLLRADPDRGGMLEAGEATRIAALIPRCTRVELPGAGHSIHSHQTAQMLELLAKFLEPALSPSNGPALSPSNGPHQVSSPRIQP